MKCSSNARYRYGDHDEVCVADQLGQRIRAALGRHFDDGVVSRVRKTGLRQELSERAAEAAIAQNANVFGLHAAL